MSSRVLRWHFPRLTNNDSAYIRTPPNKIEFSLPYSDNSGKRLSVSIDEKMKDVRITSCDFILVAVEDIEWLKQALDDISEVVKLQPNKNN